MGNFARRNGLRSGDVVRGPKSNLDFVQHFVIFLWVSSEGEEIWLENNWHAGVRWITGDQFERENPNINNIQRFSGNEDERKLAVDRALSLIGRPYSVAYFNFEHYATYAQTGKASSKQVENWFTGAMITLGVISLIAIASGASGKGRKKST